MPTRLEAIRQRLLALANPAYAAGAQRFFQDPVDPYGIKAPVIRKLAIELAGELKGETLRDRTALCEGLWKSGKMEAGGLAIELYRRWLRESTGTQFRMFGKWLECFASNWAHCDGIGMYLTAPMLDRDPGLIGELPAWSRSSKRWKRRGAAVSLVREGRQGRNLPVILQVADQLSEDGEEIVQKGAGWLLKEAYTGHGRPVVDFLAERNRRTPRLVLRYAAEKMTPADRVRVLG
ncbi:MAG: DNA alkylation repair protein [Acidobacteria bacterium]|nr:DNA alkylation repair protein [Acidobacteriota bacterium]